MAGKLYKLTFNMTDGTKQEVEFEAPQGETGANGRGIANIRFNADYTLTIIYDDNTEWTTPTSLQGVKGDSITITNIVESEIDGGSNIVNFSDGKTLTIKNGSAGATVNEIVTMTQAEYNALTKSRLQELYTQGVRLIAIETFSSSSGGSGSGATYTNQMPISIDANGNVYNGIGWSANKRISGSSGSEIDYTWACITGFMPVKLGDTIRFKYTGSSEVWDMNINDQGSYNLVAYYDASFKWLGSCTIQPANYGICTTTDAPTGTMENGGIITATVPNNANIRYVRISTYASPQNIEGLVVTINEEIL